MSRRRATKRDRFLREMDEAVPWDVLIKLIKPCYYEDRCTQAGGRGEDARVHFLQLWLNLSDKGVEETVYNSRAFSEFMGRIFGEGDQAPDTTTLLRFRCTIEDNGLAPEIFGCVNRMLEEKGGMMRCVKIDASAAEPSLCPVQSCVPLAGFPCLLFPAKSPRKSSRSEGLAAQAMLRKARVVPRRRQSMSLAHLRCSSSFPMLKICIDET